MKVVAYYRVSTAAQGRSGLGLDAQRNAVEGYCRDRVCQLLSTFTEVESGKRNDRPELAKALHYAKVTGSTLVIAKLDRLSRNAAFLLQLQDSGVKFLAVDMPEACHLTVGILALVAQQEREAISARTKAALQGNASAVAALKGAADRHAADLAPVVSQLQSEGHRSLPALAAAMNERQMRTPRGGKWHASSVRNLLARLNSAP